MHRRMFLGRSELTAGIIEVVSEERAVNGSYDTPADEKNEQIAGLIGQY